MDEEICSQTGNFLCLFMQLTSRYYHLCVPRKTRRQMHICIIYQTAYMKWQVDWREHNSDMSSSDNHFQPIQYILTIQRSSFSKFYLFIFKNIALNMYKTHIHHDILLCVGFLIALLGLLCDNNNQINCAVGLTYWPKAPHCNYVSNLE